MASTAKHIVERVWPERGVRQWVLSLPWGLRRRIAYDKRLARVVRRVWVRSLHTFFRKQAKGQGLVSRSPDAKTGTITFPQRFGSSLNLNVHFHTLALDGVYTEDEGAVRWHDLVPPSDEAVASFVERLVRKLVAKLTSLGVIDEEGLLMPPSDEAQLEAEQSWRPGLADASVQGRIASGERAGSKVERVGDRIRIVDARGGGDGGDSPRIEGRRCVSYRGFSVHADVAFGGRDRKRIERLVKYTARGPIANGRVHALGEEKERVDLKTPWRDGTTGVVFTHHELIEKLIALVPPPRANLIHYEGVFAPRHHLRSAVVSDRPSQKAPETATTTHQLELPTGTDRQIAPLDPGPENAEAQPNAPSSSFETRPRLPASPPELGQRNYRWADLLRHTFEIDVLECERCGGRMKLIAVLTDANTIEAVTASLEEDANPLEPRRARPPPDDPMSDFDGPPTQREDVQLHLWPKQDESQFDWP